MSNARITQGGSKAVVSGDPSLRLTLAGAKAVVRAKPPRTGKKPALVSVRPVQYVGIDGDPFYERVEMLLACTEQGIYDLSKKRRRLVIGSAESIYDPEESAVGDASYYTYRTTGTPVPGRRGWLRVEGPHDDFWFGTEPFTIEAWIKPTWFSSPSLLNNRTIVSYSDNSDHARCWRLRMVGNTIGFFMNQDGLVNTEITGPTFEASVWAHVAVDRDITGRVRLYFNGEMVSWIDWPHKFAKPVDGTELVLGGNGHFTSLHTPLWTGNSFGGHMDQVRITRGIARYASNAGFEVPNGPYPSLPLEDQGWGSNHGDPHWDDVTLFVDPNHSATWTDQSDVGANISVSTPRTRSTNIYWGDTSNLAYPVNSGDVVTVQDLGQYDFGSDPFTVETIGRFPSSGTTDFITWIGREESWRFRSTRSGLGFHLWNGSSWDVMVAPSGSVPLIYEWVHHMVLTRDEEGTGRFYVNGYLLGEVPDLVLPATTNPLFIQEGNISGFFYGCRITKGVCRYREGPMAEKYDMWRKWPTFGVEP